jgi:hypothetical protein
MACTHQLTFHAMAVCRTITDLPGPILAGRQACPDLYPRSLDLD